MPRRIVTGLNAAGKSVVVSDGEPPNVVTAGVGDATFSWADLWVSDGQAEGRSAGGDAPPRSILLQPAAGGLTWKIISVPPESALANVDMAALGADIAEKAPMMWSTGAHDADRPGFHRTDTIDFVVILEGELWLELEEGEVRVGAGDTVVQRGTWHAWRNRSNTPCVMSAVLLSDRAPA